MSVVSAPDEGVGSRPLFAWPYFWPVLNEAMTTMSAYPEPTIFTIRTDPARYRDIIRVAFPVSWCFGVRSLERLHCHRRPRLESGNYQFRRAVTPDLSHIPARPSWCEAPGDCTFPNLACPDAWCRAP